MPERYSPSQIGEFLTSERLAIHGVSPKVYAQNQQLIRVVQEKASKAGEHLLGVQIVGSRSNGTSDIDSDLDLITIKVAGSEDEEDIRAVERASEELGVSVDTLAAPVSGVHDEIPQDAENFMYWVDHLPGDAVGLFDEGIHITPSLLLARMAVVSMLRSYSSEIDTGVEWYGIVEQHADAYLDDPIGRIRRKLNGRLGLDKVEEINAIITPELMTTRRDGFGLQDDIEVYDRKLQQWYKKNKDSLKKLSGYKLYQDVLSWL